jgi:hypothetical protein
MDNNYLFQRGNYLTMLNIFSLLKYKEKIEVLYPNQNNTNKERELISTPVRNIVFFLEKRDLVLVYSRVVQENY